MPSISAVTFSAYKGLFNYLARCGPFVTYVCLTSFEVVFKETESDIRSVEMTRSWADANFVIRGYWDHLMAGPGLTWSPEPHFQITANEDVYNEDMQKMFPEYEWGPKILTHDRTNNEEINLLGWVFRLSIEIINVHINLSSANLHRSCILTKTEFYNSPFPLSIHAEGCPYSTNWQKNL